MDHLTFFFCAFEARQRLEAVIDQIADRRRGQEDADAGPPDHLPRGGRGADDHEEAQELL